MSAIDDNGGVTRIISGIARGHALVVPSGDATRPTTDRVREAVFSMLDASGRLEGARVLDLFSGSGALGLEALSRGASHVVLVDSSPAAVSACRRNAATLHSAGAHGSVDVVRSTIRRYLTAPRPLVRGMFDLILLDPPYAFPDDDLAAVLDAAVSVCESDAAVVVERSSRSPEPSWPVVLSPLASRSYGETSVHIATMSEPSDRVVGN